jgi:hypothetical protein
MYYVMPIQYKKWSELNRWAYQFSVTDVKKALFSRMNQTNYMSRFFYQTPRCDALRRMEPIQRLF